VDESPAIVTTIMNTRRPTLSPTNIQSQQEQNTQGRTAPKKAADKVIQEEPFDMSSMMGHTIYHSVTVCAYHAWATNYIMEILLSENDDESTTSFRGDSSTLDGGI